jgi:hypothetical protein
MTAAPLFWLRYTKRAMANALVPWWVGPRDRLCHYDRQLPWRPQPKLWDYVCAAMEEQNLCQEACEIRRFLDYWLPFQATAFAGKALIEFSVATNAPGVGLMLYGNNRKMAGAFREYCRTVSIHNRTAELCCAITDTFRPSDLTMVRAEFQPGGPHRYSIAGSWYFDVHRANSGFVESLRRLPEEFRRDSLERTVQSISTALSPDFFPLFFGLSIGGDGRLEAKMYWVRFDRESTPFYRGSRLWKFLDRMSLPQAEMAKLERCNQTLWSSSCDRMTQIAVEFTEGQSTPRRVNLIYCGTKMEAVRDAIAGLGLGESAAESIDRFQRLMNTDVAKFVAIRASPSGVSSRVKLYGHALFDMSSW